MPRMGGWGNGGMPYQQSSSSSMYVSCGAMATLVLLVGSHEQGAKARKERRVESNGKLKRAVGAMMINGDRLQCREVVSSPNGKKQRIPNSPF
jgi:hypothetical protein